VQGITIETALSYRYGLLSVNEHHDIPSTLKVKYNWLGKSGKLQTVLGHWTETVPSDRVKNLQIYLAYLDVDIGMKPKPLIPHFLSDTAPGNAVGFPYLLQQAFTVKPGVIGEEMWYHVHPRVQPSRDVDYIIVLNDALTVNQMARQINLVRSTYEIASYLLAMGVAFKTLRRQHVPRHLMWPSPPVPMFNAEIPLGLGVRYASKDKLSVDDYRHYLAEQDQVIRSYDGRAAFLSGGIVWRLAIDAMDKRDRAADGPGIYPTMKNCVLFDKSIYVDDVLTKHQEAVICGVYRLLASKYYIDYISSFTILNMSTVHIANPDAHVSFMSWWPSASTWRDSGMNVGYWTSSNEKWFRDRRDKILRGEEQPKTASQWRSTIRHHKVDMSRILASARELAASALPWIQ
jgi:hypothetical protein